MKSTNPQSLAPKVRQSERWRNSTANPLPIPMRRLTGYHSPQQWRKKFADRPFCHYCEKGLIFNAASKDHQTPLCRGGSDDIDNIVPACLGCNQAKAWRTEEEFRAVMPFFSDNWRYVRAIGKPKPGTSLEERMNEPRLLEKVIRERERVSWAWRNPV